MEISLRDSFTKVSRVRAAYDVGRNLSKKDKTRLIAVVLHPENANGTENATEIVIPEKEKK